MSRRTMNAVTCIWMAIQCVGCGAERGASRRPHVEIGDSLTVVDASWRGDRARLSALLREGVDVNLRGRHGQSALEGAAWHGDEDAVAALLESGATVGLADERALQFASVRGYAAIVRRLLDAGADPNRRDASGRSPLSLAALGGHLPVVEVLLAAGADTELRSDTGMTALMQAAARGHVTIVALLVRHGAKVAARRDDGSTAWTLAVERNDRRMMEVLQAPMAAARSTPRGF
jgi:uncharacterized protein